MKALNIRFSDKEHKDLQEMSQHLERSINDLVREAVREHLVNYHTLTLSGRVWASQFKGNSQGQQWTCAHTVLVLHCLLGQ